MPDRVESFLELSACLTGFDRLELLGTGMADAYIRTLDSILPEGLSDRLLAAYDGLPAGDGCRSGVSEKILDDPELGPVSRNLIVLWYRGTWTQLPDDWRAAYGSSAQDYTHVVSAKAYLSGLQWVAAGAHPPGGQEQGYGAWSMPPKGNG